VAIPTPQSRSSRYIFVDFRNSDDANQALAVLNNHPFDAKHTFKLNRFSDVETFATLDETYIEPEDEEYTPKASFVPAKTCWSNAANSSNRNISVLGSQIHKAVISMSPTAATTYKYTGMGSPLRAKSHINLSVLFLVSYNALDQTVVAHQDWKDFLYVAWSPMGTYIATLHRQGVRLWGGPSWKHQQRFAHPLVKLIDFSPCEQYLVTWSNEPIVVPEGATQGPQYFSPDDEGNNIAVWDIKSGDLLRTFSSDTGASSTRKQMQWPALKWSPDDKFVARVTPGQMISVHELPSMYLHGKKSIKIEGVVDFEWCPLGDKDKEDESKAAANGIAKPGSKKTRENMLVYWTPEVANQPARVTLLAFPSRAILRQKNLFNVTEVCSWLLVIF
jgi:translation initiation factor 3 subunit B